MNERSQEMPGMLSGLVAVTRRDLLLAWKRPGDVVNPLFFFAMVCQSLPLFFCKFHALPIIISFRILIRKVNSKIFLIRTFGSSDMRLKFNCICTS